MTPYRFDQIRPEPLLGKCLTIIGYGSQGRAQALNLRDSGFDVRIGLRRGSRRWEIAIGDGFDPRLPAEACADADVIALLLPDTAIADVFRDEVRLNLKKGATLLFAHGLAVHAGWVSIPKENDAVLVAPMGPGSGLRAEYVAGRGIATLVAGSREERALAWAWGLGSHRAVVLPTSFQEETETDLFGEQAVLCGGIPALVLAGFEVLTEAGYSEEAAYFECVHQLSLITDLIVAGGLTGMRSRISSAAEFGGDLARDAVGGERLKDPMRDILAQVRSGHFAKRLLDEAEAGFPLLAERAAQDAAHPMERIGSAIRLTLGENSPQERA